MVEWKTGRLLPHTPDVLSTIQHPVTFDPSAKCPEVERFLATVLQPDSIEFGIELIAYALYPKGNPFQKAVQLLGPGGNGKSRFLGLLRALVGPSNTAAVPLQTLAERPFAAASLYGTAANICGDLDARSIERSDTFKQLVGGDPVHADRKYQDPFEFINRSVPYFSANEAPMTSDQSPAWFDRWLTVPFTRRIRGTELEDPYIEVKLTRPSELSGLLNLCLDAMRTLDERGRFDVPGSAQEAGDDYRNDLDSARGFVLEECTLDSDGFAVQSKLDTAYENWCQAEGRRKLRRKNFYRHLRENFDGVTPGAIQGQRGFHGIKHPQAGTY